jgi:hypothetical protein
MTGSEPKLYTSTDFLKRKKILKRFTNHQKKPENLYFQAFYFSCDPNGTNFKSFYAGFNEIGLLYVGAVFEWHEQFGLDVLLGIEEK